MHFAHFQIPLESLFTPSFSQKGHFCFNLCFDSTFTNLALTDFPYFAPNLPADFDFFNFGVILLEMGLPGFEPGSPGPKPGRLPSYPTAP